PATEAKKPAVKASHEQKSAANEKPKPLNYGQIEIKGGYPEGSGLPGLFSNVTETMADAVARLDKAAVDDKLDGLVVRISQPTLGWGKTHELRQAILRVRAKGKRCVAYFESASTHDYLVASACNEIVIPESGGVEMLGMRA